jgi:hypothetical protein
MLSAIIAYLAYLLCSENSWSVGESVLYGALWVILMSTAGKLLGLAFARVRLHMLRTTLRREFSANSDKNARWK